MKKKGKSTIPFRCETCEVGGEKPKGKIQKLSRPPGGQDRPGQYSPQGGSIVVDVLALYTEKARKGAGASSNEPNNQDHIKNLFQSYIDTANEALKNSGLDVEFNIVHKKEVDFKEPDKEGALSDTLGYMEDESDGIMDEIASLKKKYKPDLVSLLVSTQFGKSWDQIRAGGSGFISGRAFTAIDFRHFNDDGMYSTVNIAYVNDVYELSDLTLAHELGHNFGCNHDRDNYNRDGGLYDYGHGHTFKVKGTTGADVFCRTIMAYQSDLNEREIPYFSNPDVNFFKVPTGVKEGRSDSANNAKVIRLTAPLVAQINGGEEEVNKPPVIVEMFPDEGDVIDVSVDGYITFYDPDGEVESLSFNGSLVDKEYWEKLDNGYWKLTIEWDDEEPDTSYSFEVVVVDNDGAEAKKRISFKIKPVIVEVFPKEGSVVDVETDPYVVFYDPDGEIEKLYISNILVRKEKWVKLQNGQWRGGLDWAKLKNQSYSYEVKVVDNDGLETKRTTNFKAIEENKPPVIVEVFPKEGSVVDVETDPYVVFYDPDGEIEKLYISNILVRKEKWVKLQNGQWRGGLDWVKLKNQSYSYEVKLVDNDGAETKQTINFKTIQENKPPVIVKTFPEEGSVVSEFTDPYVVFYDPDGEIKSLSFNGVSINKNQWAKLEGNGYWKFIARTIKR
ncbi:zinc-dependent metalloprotease, partial [Verrucomicrobia bacterium]|nr:zinc-dependent metalloprotease [Verrucomicrobiota bacterium]